MKIYIASPFFSEEELSIVIETEQILRARGYEVFSPRLYECREEPQTAQWAEALFHGDVNALKTCDAVVMLYHGNYSDTGTAWECGYAYASGIPIVVVQLGTLSNIMVHVSATANISLKELNTYDFAHMPVIPYRGDMT